MAKKLKLKNHPGVIWPPTEARVRDNRLNPTPDPGDFDDAELQEVRPLASGTTSVDLHVALAGSKQDKLLAVDVRDPDLRKPLEQFLRRHKGKTITELGTLDVDF